MKLFTKSMEPNTTLGVAERVAYMSGNIRQKYLKIQLKIG